MKLFKQLRSLVETWYASSFVGNWDFSDGFFGTSTIIQND
jgi:hypothetical protein